MITVIAPRYNATIKISIGNPKIAVLYKKILIQTDRAEITVSANSVKDIFWEAVVALKSLIFIPTSSQHCAYFKDVESHLDSLKNLMVDRCTSGHSRCEDNVLHVNISYEVFDTVHEITRITG